MKKYVNLILLSLLSLASYGQGWQWVRKQISGVDGYAYRNLSVYPATVTGGNSFTAAVKAGQIPVQLTDPRTIPAGVKSKLTFSANNDEIYIKSAGDIKELKFERIDGTAMSGYNADNPVLNTGVFYGAGSENDAPYDRQWKIRFSGVAGKQMKLTYKQASGATFSFGFVVPTSSVSNVQLFGTTTATVTPPTVTPPTTTAGYSKILVIGNSIHHNIWDNKNWGMAATSADKDFLHILKGYHLAANPNAQYWEIADVGMNYGFVEGSFYEQYYWQLDNTSIDIVRGGLSRYDVIADLMLDALYIELGDNITDNSHDLQSNMTAWIKRMIAKKPSCKVFISSTIITPGTSTNAIFQSMCAANGWIYVNNQGISGANAILNHPDDGAHKKIADNFWAATPKTTVVTPPTTTTTTPGLAYNYPVPSSSMGWTAYNNDVLSNRTIGDVIRMESNELTVEARKGYGGAIQVIDKATNQKLISFTDWGREAELSLYSGPSDFSAGGYPEYAGIGWNPLTVGDISNNAATIKKINYVTGNDGKLRLYIQSQGINWPTNNVQMDVYFERWIALTGKEVDVYSRQTFFRSDQTFYEARLQEYPTFMRPGKSNVTRYYTGNAPYTNAPVTQTLNLNADGSAFGGGNFMVSEPWVATEQDGVHFFLNTERMGTVASTVYRPEWNNFNHEGNFQTTYNNSENRLTVDPNGVWYHHYGFYATNNFDEGRAWANGRPRLYGDKPDFDFTTNRQDWYVDKGTDQRPPFSSPGWKITLVPTADGVNPDGTPKAATSARSSLNSPVGSWKATQTPKLYVTLKYGGQASQLKLSFKRNGQADVTNNNTAKYSTWYPNGFWDYANQYFTISPIKDGQYHTYEINCAANSAWKDVIQSFQLGHMSSDPTYPQETIEIKYIGYKFQN